MRLTFQLGAGLVTNSGRPARPAGAPRNHSMQNAAKPVCVEVNIHIILHNVNLWLSAVNIVLASARAQQSHTPPDAQRVGRSAPYKYGHLIEAFNQISLICPISLIVNLQPA